MLIDKLISLAGLGLVVYAYIPQIRHLANEHCSAGISRKAYWLWLVAAALLLVHSIIIQDVMFIVLQSVVLILTSFILILARRYQGGACPAHRAQASGTP